LTVPLVAVVAIGGTGLPPLFGLGCAGCSSVETFVPTGISAAFTLAIVSARSCTSWRTSSALLPSIVMEMGMDDSSYLIFALKDGPGRLMMPPPRLIHLRGDQPVKPGARLVPTAVRLLKQRAADDGGLLTVELEGDFGLELHVFPFPPHLWYDGADN
jgi:hypothetical protein